MKKSAFLLLVLLAVLSGCRVQPTGGEKVVPAEAAGDVTYLKTGGVTSLLAAEEFVLHFMTAGTPSAISSIADLAEARVDAMPVPAHFSKIGREPENPDAAGSLHPGFSVTAGI